MSIYWDQMFNATTNATALTSLQGDVGTSTSGYSVLVAGRLIKVVLLLAGQAATSLLERLRVELTCTRWNPNTSRFSHVGGALRTAPAFPIIPGEFPFDQPVVPEIKVTGTYLFNVTAVTPDIAVLGMFTTNPASSPINAHPGA